MHATWAEGTVQSGWEDFDLNWLVIFVIVCVGLFGFIGYRRGLIKTLFSLIATILALVLSYLLTPLVSDFLLNKTKLGETIEDKVYVAIEKKVEETVGSSEKEAKKAMEKNPAKKDQVKLLQDLRIPDFLEKMLLENNNAQGYKDLGVDNVYRYAAKSIAGFIMNIIAGMLTFIIIRLLMMILVAVLTAAVNKFTILMVVNKTGGVIAGVILGIIIVWVVMFVLSLAMKGDAYTNLLKDNGGLQWLHDHNVLMKISLKDIFS